MKKWLAVVKKEIIDNIRDKRSLFFALLYGPVLLPLMMVGPMAMGVKKHTINFDETQSVYMVAPETAPNLVQFLREKNVEVKAANTQFRQQVIDQDVELVIELAPNYDQALRDGKAAAIRLYYNKNNDDSSKTYRKIHSVLQNYNRSLAAMRLDVRGLSTAFLSPIQILQNDLGEADDADKVISMIVPFIVVLSLTMGGFYLAVDSTAGERERHSLEPLLTLSMSRSTLVLGKLFALMTFVSVSGLLAVTSTYLLLAFIPVEELTAFLQVEILVFVGVFLLCSPLIPFFSTSMMLIAAFARNTKEAQTHLGMAMMLPMVPFFVMQFANVQGNEILTAVPVMGQFILIKQLVAGEAILMLDLLRSVGVTLASAVLFFILILQLYKKERILGA